MGSNAYATIAQLAAINGTKLADFESSNVLEMAPLLQKLAAVSATEKAYHKYLRKTTGAGVAFRAFNAGANLSRSQDEVVSVTLSVLDASFDVDVALANAYTKGKDAYLAIEMNRALKAAFASLEDQIILGTTSDATGFEGFADLVDSGMVIDANATDSDAYTQIFMVRTAPDGAAVAVGSDGQISVSDTYMTRALDGSSHPFDVFRTPVLGLVGVQGGGVYDIGMIKDIGHDTFDSDTMELDEMLGALYAKFVNGEPNLIVMHRTAAEALRRGYTNQGTPVPVLDNWNGIPIVKCRACGTLAVDELSG